MEPGKQQLTWADRVKERSGIIRHNNGWREENGAQTRRKAWEPEVAKQGRFGS